MREEPRKGENIPKDVEKSFDKKKET